MLDLVRSGWPPLGERCICPKPKQLSEGKTLLDLSWAGPELSDAGVHGDNEITMTVNFEDSIPRDIKVIQPGHQSQSRRVEKL